jgi:hypothetical protein
VLARAQPGSGRYVYDRACTTTGHRLDRVGGAEHHSEEVYLHNSPPSPGGGVREVQRLHTPSVVHQDGEPSEFLLRASEQVPHIRCARHVRQHREGASPSAPDLIRDSPCAIPIDVGNHHCRIGRRQSIRRGPADARGGARYDATLPLASIAQSTGSHTGGRPELGSRVSGRAPSAKRVGAEELSVSSQA